MYTRSLCVLLSGLMMFPVSAWSSPQSGSRVRQSADYEDAAQQDQQQSPTVIRVPDDSEQSGPALYEDGHTRLSPERAAAEDAASRKGRGKKLPLGGTKPRELTEFQKMVASSIGETLPIYGESLFQNVPTTFAPVDRAPVTADYVVGPGDELLIRGWGQIDLDVHARVDRNGAIYIPKVGQMNVAGLKFAQLQGYLKSQVGRIFQNFDLNVTMGDLRSIDIFVVGQANHPGRYTVSSLSTLANAVFAAGGPSAAGSMRRIQLKRGATMVTDFDLYDLLLKGDKSKDVVLQPEDVIYFAPVGPQVALGGQVNSPAIYELKNETSLDEVVQLAGGLSTTAYGAKVYIEQIKNHDTRDIEEVKLDSAGMARMLHDGDVLNFAEISPRFANAVTLRGNVASPGRYPWHEGMRVCDLIPNRDFLITRQYWNQQNAITLKQATANDRFTMPDTNPNAGYDRLITASNATDGNAPVTTASNPIRETAPVSTAANQIGRNAPDVNWDYAVIQRLSEGDLSTELVPFNLGKAVLQHDPSSNVELLPGDVVTVFSQADLRVTQEQQTKLVRLEGEFVSSGVYRAHQGETLRDLVARSGGLSPSAYLYGAVFTRESTRAEQQQRLNLLVAQMERDIVREQTKSALNAHSGEEANLVRTAADSERLNLAKLRQIKADGRVVLNFHPNDQSLDAVPAIPLEDGDEFYVPSRPIVVNVFGDVYNPGSFLQHAGKTTNRYLRDAGGPTRAADKNHIFVVLANGAVVNKDTAGSFWSGGFDNMVLMPGDTVIVPEQLNPGAGWRKFKDFSQILFNFGLAGAAINVLR